MPCLSTRLNGLRAEPGIGSIVLFATNDGEGTEEPNCWLGRRVLKEVE